MSGRIRFCPRCGSIMYPRREGARYLLVCKSCGYSEEGSSEDQQAYRMRVTVEKGPRDKIVVIDDETPMGAQVLKGSVSCPKCGHDEVYFWMMQTRSADEPMTRFYRCKRCRYTWREYA
ncbi:transcription factor S [Aeropyrum camini]|uniref:transcription factor S n=1 Tax=Aeropyrum camini TaxID=229980 RepID=UPI00078723CD|nr:transcription factor S [Aeropyrum camini]